jgi:hypothetical protein
VPVDPSLLRSLADGGGLVLFLMVVVTAAVGLHRQWLVPGWVYRDLVVRLLEALQELSAARKTIDRLTVQLARERRHRTSEHHEDA